MPRFITSLLLGSSLLLSAQATAESLTWATEMDLLPIATGGWYTSLAAGRGAWRVRAVAAEVHVPDAFAPRGWVSSRTQAQALLVDRFIRPGFTGPWVGAGFERWNENLKLEHGPERVKLKSLQATLGAGWVFELGRGFTLNPWMAVHQRIAVDHDATIRQTMCRPKAIQAEASLKIGYTFNHQ